MASETQKVDTAPAYTGEAPRVISPGPGPIATPRLGIWELAWPAIVNNLLHSLVGLVGIKMVGSLGAGAVAAVTTGNRVFFILQALLMAVTAGTTALVARAWGAGDRDEAERVNRASIWVCVSISLVITLPAVVFADPLARVFRLEEETLLLAATYIRWISWFNAAFALQFVLCVALRAAGDARTPLWIGALTNVANIVLLYALVYGRLGFPAMGVAGAALAGGAAFAIGSIAVVYLWLRGDLILGVGPPRCLERQRVLRLVNIGYPAGLEQVVWQGGFVLFLWIVSLYGTAPYAAYGIGVSILSFSFLIGWGFSIAASTLVGQHLGAGDPEGATRSGWRAARLSLASMVVFGLAIVAGAWPLARWMIDDAEVVRLTVVFIYVLGGLQPLMAIEFALTGSLRGAGDTRFPLITVLSGLVLVRCVLAGIFAWLDFSVEWIFYALIADYIVKATMLTLRFRGGRWKTVIKTAVRQQGG
jgi:putative MATE family efflux protein